MNMGENSTASTSAAAASASAQISLFFGDAILLAAEGGASRNPFFGSSSSYYHQPQHCPPPPAAAMAAALERGSGGEDSGAGTGSEEGLDVLEEPMKPVRSGSKRSRAAEVHNLSEKRRRSRINEKMKALQNLIPNSNKTDKASMLDEAIEYLKQLQLQVQMLSMRNGLTSQPMYLPGTMHPLHASHLCTSFGDRSSAVNLGVLGMLPLNQECSRNNSIDLTSQCTTSHQPVALPAAQISAPETSFQLEPSQSHHPSFHLQVPSEEIFTEHIVQQQQLDAERITGNVLKTVESSSSLHLRGQASSGRERNDQFEDVLSENQPSNNPLFDQNFEGSRLPRGGSFPEDGAKSEDRGV